MTRSIDEHPTSLRAKVRRSCPTAILLATVAGALILPEHTTSARTRCPPGQTFSGERCVLQGPGDGTGGGGGAPQGPSLAACQAATPASPVAGCGPLLTPGFNAGVSQAIASGNSRLMYDADNRAYPANLSSTIPSNLAPGAYAKWNAGSMAQMSSSVLTYAALLSGDWLAQRTSNGYAMLDRIDNAFFSAHPKWLQAVPGVQPSTSTNGMDTTTRSGRALPTLPNLVPTAGSVTSCAEYTWKLWQSFSLPEDRARLCGADAACAVDMLDVPGGPGDTSVTHHVDASRVRPAADLTMPATEAIRPRNPFLGASSKFLYVQDDMLRLLAERHATLGCSANWVGPQVEGTPYASTSPSYPNLGAQLQAQLANIQPTLDAKYTYSYGPTFAGIGGNNVAWSNEFAFVTAMMNDTIHGPSPVPASTRLAMRQRAQHFQALLDAYDQLTTFTCASPGPIAIASAAKSAPTRAKPRAQASISTGGGTTQYGTTFVSPSQPLSPDQLVAAARDLQDQIVEALLEEQQRGDSGCFTTNHRDCDWFPEDAAPLAMGQFADLREADFQDCVRWTADSFTQQDNPGLPDNGGTDGVTTWLTNKAAAAESMLRGMPGVDAPVGVTSATGENVKSGRQAMGQIVGGHEYYGDSNWFGGGYRYATFWKLAPDTFGGPSNTPCSLQGEVHGEVHARADVLSKTFDNLCSICEQQFEDVTSVAGQDLTQLPGYTTLGSLCRDAKQVCEYHYRLQHLADAEVDLQSTSAGNTLNGDFFFGGEQIWQDVAEPIPSSFDHSYVGDPITTETLSTTVSILGIPVTFMVHGEVHYGVVFNGSLTNNPDGTCTNPTIDAKTQFAPWAYADAIGSVGIGYDFLQAGVRGKVRLVDASLPVNGRLWVDQRTFNASMDAHLDIGLLDGSLSLFAQIGPEPTPLEAEQEIYSWRGDHDRVSIFDPKPLSVPLPAISSDQWTAYTNGTL